MLPSYLQVKRIMNAGSFLLMLMLSIYIMPAYSQTTQTTTVKVVSAADMLQNIVSQVPFIMQLATAFGYVVGLYFIVIGLMKLKQFGEARTQMSHEHHLREPLAYLIIGALLIYLPSSVQIGLSTFWSAPSPYGYMQEANQWSDFIKDVFLVVQLFGTIAFIRGLIILSHLGGTHGHQGAFGKGVTHIIAGLLCINIYQFVQVIMITLGIQTSA